MRLLQQHIERVKVPEKGQGYEIRFTKSVKDMSFL